MLIADIQDSFWENAVVYQIYPRSFHDANGDGEGDIEGMYNRLWYLHDLGVDTIWLSPFYPSPLADGGYDVADYCAVDPRFGSMDDFDTLITHAHKLGIRVIIDIVPNHTSCQHPWFRRAIVEGPQSEAAAWYVFRRGKGSHGELPPTNWLSNFGGSAWEPCGGGWYYLHLFAREQPDLNWDNPKVQDEFLRILKFWCDRGVDGFRIDVSHGLSKDLSEPLRDRLDPMLMGPQTTDGSDPLWDRDQVHRIYRSWRKLFDQYRPVKYAVGELWTPFSQRIFQYASKDEIGAVFDFSLSKACWNAGQYRKCIERTHRSAREAGTSPTWVLGNHDVPRLASRLGLPPGVDIESWVTSNGSNPAIDPVQAALRARAAALIMLGLPGTAFVYQGEELGLPEDFELKPDEVRDPNWERSGHRFKGRDGYRVPLPWSSKGASFGFNSTGASWLPQPGWFARFAIDQQISNEKSFLEMYRFALSLRRRWVSTDVDLSFSWTNSEKEQGDLLGWRLPSGLSVLANFSMTHTIPLPKKCRVLLSSAEKPANEDSAVIPPQTAVWLAP